MNKKKQEAIERLSTRWNNMNRIMQSLVSEFSMFKAAHENLLRGHYEDTPCINKANNLTKLEDKK